MPQSRNALALRRQPDLHDGRADYHVLNNWKLIGRIYQRVGSIHGTREEWFWTITVVRRDRMISSGSAASLEAAKVAFKAAWE
jgi:hypothetical protein